MLHPFDFQNTLPVHVYSTLHLKHRFVTVLSIYRTHFLEHGQANAEERKRRANLEREDDGEDGGDEGNNHDEETTNETAN